MRYALALLLLCVCGCMPGYETTAKPKSAHWIEDAASSLIVAEIDGHEYTIVHGGRSVGVCHHFGCPCLMTAEKP